MSVYCVLLIEVTRTILKDDTFITAWNNIVDFHAFLFQEKLKMGLVANINSPSRREITDIKQTFVLWIILILIHIASVGDILIIPWLYNASYHYSLASACVYYGNLVAQLKFCYMKFLIAKGFATLNDFIQLKLQGRKGVRCDAKDAEVRASSLISER
ncbi:hypothetical protein QAD02_016740 [Eretmocerus hayati]|uniref:Uncharacterized protein n=1 Tax=Eretmocerus hayati TaxID=131215 RepID=A0ACC2PD05_9HYME|nr:hypothetical protein QAD02_016740 [Eretmocerus hayati]